MGVSLDWAGFIHLRRQLAGLRRLKGEGAGRKLPIRPPLLLRMAAVLPGGSRWHALFVCCVVGVLGMLRRSNLVPGALSLFGQEKHLTRADITIDGAKYALRLRGFVGAVPAPADAPAFSYFDDAGALRSLSFDALAAGIKHLVAAVGLDPASYSTHSLRRGGATWAFEHKVPTLLIKATGDWSSDAYEAYLTLGPGEKL
ncbi:hypothetical protein MNEG_14407, partial [Monoraphidium neglectum]